MSISQSILDMQMFAAPQLSQHYVHQMALCAKDHSNVLPADISHDFPSYACLLGNLLEAAGVSVAQPGSLTWVKESSFFIFWTIFSFHLYTLYLCWISHNVLMSLAAIPIQWR